MDYTEVMGMLSDRSRKQMLFFHELCKAGAVKFDMGNAEHRGMLFKMAQMMQEDISAGDTLLERKERNLACTEIMLQVLLHCIPSEKD